MRDIGGVHFCGHFAAQSVAIFGVWTCAAWVSCCVWGRPRIDELIDLLGHLCFCGI